jgi:hypothetical protein
MAKSPSKEYVRRSAKSGRFVKTPPKSGSVTSAAVKKAIKKVASSRLTLARS